MIRSSSVGEGGSQMNIAKKVALALGSLLAAALAGGAHMRF